MNISNETTLRILTELIAICKNGQHGFQLAAEETKDPDVSRLFLEYSVQRGEFVRELQGRARSLGGDPASTACLSGAFHRRWMNLKTALSSNESHAVLEECERGEDVAIEAFRKGLREDLDPITRGVASRQYVGIQSAHDRLKQLRNHAACQRA